MGEDMDMFITDLKSYFYSQVKEVWEYHVFILDQADFLRNGSVKRSMDLSKKDQEDLWKCIETRMSSARLTWDSRRRAI